MKGAWKWIVQVVLGVWLVLLTACTVMWVRSYWRSDQIVYVVMRPDGTAKRFYDTMLLVWNGNVHIHFHRGYFPAESNWQALSRDIHGCYVFDHDLGIHA